MASIHKARNKWRVQIRKHGHAISRTFTKKSDASRWAASEESRLEMLRNRPEEVLKIITLADLLRRYLKEITPTKRASTADREATRINRLLKQTIATTTLDRLTPGIIATYRDQRLNEIMEGSVRHDLCLISLAVDAARKEWDVPITTNPVSLIRKPRSPKPRQRRLTVDEWSKLMVAAKQSYQASLADMVEFAVETAMRRSELVRISPADVMLDKSLLHIPVTKNGHPRTIPLSDRATTIARQYYDAKNATLFPLSYHQLGRAFRMACVDAGINDYHFHDIRHEAVSRFTEMGLSPIEVSLISGHQDLRVLMNYSHMRVEAVGAKLK